MCSDLSCYQLEVRLLFTQDGICEPHSDHKGKTHSKYAKENDK